MQTPLPGHTAYTNILISGLLLSSFLSTLQFGASSRTYRVAAVDKDAGARRQEALYSILADPEKCRPKTVPTNVFVGNLGTNMGKHILKWFIT